MSGSMNRRRRLAVERGQAAILLVGGLAAIVVGAFVLAAVARGVGEQGDAQRAADLAALAGARAMHAAYGRLFEPPFLGHRPNPRRLSQADYLALGRATAIRVARANGGERTEVGFPDRDSFAPVRIRVAVGRGFAVGDGRSRRHTELEARAEAELAPPDGVADPGAGGGYDGPLAHRQGKPMRPDVALAFDRMERAARAGGVTLLINSAYRSDAEQAELWRRNPDPRWVAPPGRSLHRYGTELDLGPDSAHSWLARHAERFHFVQRYSWEPWHYGFALNPGSNLAAAGSRGAGDGGDGHVRGLPSFVPARFQPLLARAAQRWNVSATLLAAQLYAESNFNPFAVSPAGARGIAQFMPGTAAALGLDDPFDAEQSIQAQARLMRDLLRRFASVPLALAAYNAGAGAVAGCGCVPPYPETRAYVAKIMGLMSGAGEPLAAGPGAGLIVRLVR